MNEKDFRIGNIVKLKNNTNSNKSYITISSIDNQGDGDYVIEDSSGFLFNIKDIEPIELNEEDLLKGNFIFNKGVGYLIPNTDYFIEKTEINGLKNFNFIIYREYHTISIKINFLHELQNILFVLCKIDFNIKINYK